MTIQKFRPGLSLVLFAILITAVVQVPSPEVLGQEYEEISYDELVQRLSRKKSRMINDQQGASILDDILIHAGFALLSSDITYNFAGSERQGRLTGFQFSFGIDLFNPHWAAVSYIRNLGGATSNSQEIKSNREFDILLIYKNFGNSNTPGFHFGGGFGQRFLSAAEAGHSLEETTPLMILLSGLDYHFNRNFSFGAELGLRTSLMNESKDKSSFDFTIKMDTYF